MPGSRSSGGIVSPLGFHFFGVDELGLEEPSVAPLKLTVADTMFAACERASSQDRCRRSFRL